MKQHHDLMRRILAEGHTHPDRTGVGRKSVFGVMMRFDLSKGEFPFITTRKVPFKGMVNETLWFVRGSTNVKDLQDVGVNIWNPWAVNRDYLVNYIEKTFDESHKPQFPIYLQQLSKLLENSVGPMYGSIWRNAPNNNRHPMEAPIPLYRIEKNMLLKYEEDYKKRLVSSAFEDTYTLEEYQQRRASMVVDQLQNVILSLKERPYSSRHIITSWIPELVPDETRSPQENVMLGKGALAACHVLQQYFVKPPLEEGGKMRLSLMMTQRSIDVPVGATWNIPQYCLLLTMVARTVGMDVDEFIYVGGDAHIYTNQEEQVREQLSREPREMPRLVIAASMTNLFDAKAEDFFLQGYDPHPAINYPVAV